jgi:hypothetical protein
MELPRELTRETGVNISRTKVVEMSSNIKPKLARHPELELSFAARRPGLAGAARMAAGATPSMMWAEKTASECGSETK